MEGYQCAIKTMICPGCRKKLEFKITKNGNNKGREYARCDKCNKFYCNDSITTGIGFYAWPIILLIALLSVFFHTCQTTSFCPLYINLHTLQKLDHTLAVALLAFTILLFILKQKPKTYQQRKIHEPS